MTFEQRVWETGSRLHSKCEIPEVGREGPRRACREQDRLSGETALNLSWSRFGDLKEKKKEFLSSSVLYKAKDIPRLQLLCNVLSFSFHMKCTSQSNSSDHRPTVCCELCSEFISSSLWGELRGRHDGIHDECGIHDVLCNVTSIQQDHRGGCSAVAENELESKPVRASGS